MSLFQKAADDIGQLRHRVDIIQLTESTESDYGGNALTSSTTLDTVWAAWNAPESGSGEVMSAGQKELSNNVRFVLRYRSDVKTNMLILYESVYYDILSILPDSTRQYMVLETRQRGDSFNPTVT